MAYYRLYIFTRGHISAYRAFESPDDGDAVEWARELADGEPAELWSGARHVHDYGEIGGAVGGLAASRAS